MTRVLPGSFTTGEASLRTSLRALVRSKLVPPFLLAGGVLVLAVAIVVGEWRDGSIGNSAAIAGRDLVFEALPDGRLAVRDDASGAEVAMLPSSSEGFVATTVKGLARERRRYGAPEDAPYRLRRWSGGRMTVTDPVVGTEIELLAFGQTNAAAFAEFLKPRRTEP